MMLLGNFWGMATPGGGTTAVGSASPGGGAVCEGATMGMEAAGWVNFDRPENGKK